MIDCTNKKNYSKCFVSCFQFIFYLFVLGICITNLFASYRPVSLLGNDNPIIEFQEPNSSYVYEVYVVIEQILVNITDNRRVVKEKKQHIKKLYRECRDILKS